MDEKYPRMQEEYPELPPLKRDPQDDEMMTDEEMRRYYEKRDRDATHAVVDQLLEFEEEHPEMNAKLITNLFGAVFDG